jgi:hypothetical protein
MKRLIMTKAHELRKEYNVSMSLALEIAWRAYKLESDYHFGCNYRCEMIEELQLNAYISEARYENSGMATNNKPSYMFADLKVGGNYRDDSIVRWY